MGSNLQLNGFRYSRPNTKRNREGNIVLISAFSIGPAEVRELGINASGQPYKRDDMIDEDATYEKIISRSELVGELQRLISYCKAKGYPDWAAAYENALLWLNTH